MRPPGYEPGALPLRQIALFFDDAKNFIIYVQTVRKKELAKDKRTSQIDAAWYRHAEVQKLWRFSLHQGDAPACRIHPAKNHCEISPKSFSNYSPQICFTSPSSPWSKKYRLAFEGWEAAIEFSNLLDAIRAHNDLNAGPLVFWVHGDLAQENGGEGVEGTKEHQRWKKQMGYAGLETSVGDDGSGCKFPRAGAIGDITGAGAKELVAGVTSAELSPSSLHLNPPQTAASVAVEPFPSSPHLSSTQTANRSMLPFLLSRPYLSLTSSWIPSTIASSGYVKRENYVGGDEFQVCASYGFPQPQKDLIW
ncbi:hypothetical protein V500_01099 [Pseudogymnoascus sp. VKM F-4518 (FW-2643)]|nr:hypothetical protein V500_01099 [Pseudogymnoascus sp. VKM F-4518 (FW-2643)]